jgi:hypothetical protein
VTKRASSRRFGASPILFTARASGAWFMVGVALS